MNRRLFLKITTLAAGGLLVSFKYLSSADAEEKSPLGGKFSALLTITAAGEICIVLSKVEMGQSIWTTFAMLVAEELDCDWQKITVTHAPPGEAADFKEPPIFRSTGGSESTKSEFDRYRMAGATARTMLVTVAAKRLGFSPDACRTENGFVRCGEHRVPYGELATEASKLPVPEVTLREPGAWKIIGKGRKRLDGFEKVNGRAKYGIDVAFPGLLTAMVAHPPVFGARVKAFDATAAKTVRGVRAVVVVPTGVAVVAEHFWAAKTGRDALKIEWDDSGDRDFNSGAQWEEYQRLAKTTGATISRKGDVDVGMRQATTTLHSVFTFPYLAHAPMEPLNCTVKIEEDACEVWVGTQSPLLHQAEIAAFLKISPEKVKLHTPHLGGSFGRRGSFSGDWVMEAVHIAKAAGSPVKLVWSREDDIKGGYYRPVYVHDVAIGIGTDGYPLAWKHCIVGQSLFANTPLQDFIVVNGIDYSSVTDGAPYSEFIPNTAFELHTTTACVPVLPWRSVGNTHTAFVMETLVDDLAVKADKDPIDYRRPLLAKSPRHLRVLEVAAEKSSWRAPLPPGRARGIAVHAAMGSYVCQVAEVSIVDEQIKVHRVVCVIDCGLAVNPDGVRAQMEGSIGFALSAALYGEITLENGQVRQSNFHDYPLLRIDEAPAIEVHIVESSEKIGGAGEPGVPPLAPAVANAVFAATGRRLTSLPLRISG